VVYFPAATVQHRIGGSSDTLPNRAIVERHRGMWRYYSEYLRPRRAIMRPITDGVVWTGIQLRCLAQLAAHSLRRRTGMTGR
jgi:GT2 family glycosyltransferase